MSSFSCSQILSASWSSWETWRALLGQEASHSPCVSGETAYVWKLLELYSASQTILTHL